MSETCRIQSANRWHVDDAIGWLGLGNLDEAARMIERVTEPDAQHPDVLEIRWEIAGRRKRWQGALEIAEALVGRWPDRCSGRLHRSYSLHELQRTLEAWNKLVPAVERFPREATIPYNLACYACQLGNLDQAKSWLEKAVSIRGRATIKDLALKDDDLLPLRSLIAEW